MDDCCKPDFLDRLARKQGLWDYGDSRFRPGLEVLRESISAETKFSRLGRLIVHRTIGHYLRNRLLIQETLRQHPAIEDQQLRPPMFIVGLNRSGTTVLHNLLALADDARAPRTWELFHPTPPCSHDGLEAARRRFRVRMALLALHGLSPRLRRVHRIGANDREECYPLINHTFTSPAFAMHYELKPYARWLNSLDPAQLRWVYREYTAQLKILQIGHPPCRWVLKSTVHLYFLEALLQEFPDAHIVFTHRDPRQMVPSICSLVASLRQVVHRSIDPEAIGAECLAFVRLLLECGQQALANHPEARIISIGYDQLVADPLRQVRHIHEMFDLGWAPGHERRMQQWLTANPANRHGHHDYSAKTYGLKMDQLESLYPQEMVRLGSARP
jgi:hypothetical protein